MSRSAHCRADRLDIVTMDIDMPRLDGVEATRILHARRPELPVVLLSASDSGERVTEALAV
jgi:DNA-binding NarL/FixJ family response regulator